MKGMKKKGRGREREEAKNSKKLLTLSVVIAAVLVSSVLIAAADITSFEITPDKSKGCEVSAYEAILKTTGFASLNMTIPAGFVAVAPEDGMLIADVQLWDDVSNHYHITLTANGTDKIDMRCRCGGDEVKYTLVDVSYEPGEEIEIEVPFGSASLKLPTDTENGFLSMSSSKTLTQVIINIEKFVMSPTACGDYTFIVEVNGDTDSDTVRIVGGKPDLVITDIWIGDDGKRLYYTIENKGCARARESYSGLWIDNDFKTDKVNELASGENSTESFKYKKWTCEPGANISIKVCADYHDKIKECDEENNCMEKVEKCPNNAASMIEKIWNGLTKFLP